MKVCTSALRAHVLRAELGLGLRFKYRFLDFDADRRANGGADVDRVEVLLIELLDGFGQRLAEGAEVRPAHGGVLAVDEGVIVLAVAAGVGEGDLDVLVLEMNDRVERIAVEFVFEQVVQALVGFEFLAVVDNGQAAVEEGVVPQIFDIVLAEADRTEDLRVGVSAGGCRCAHRWPGRAGPHG